MIQNITLRDMKPEEYEHWKEGSITYYAQSLTEAGKCPEAESMDRAEADFLKVMNGISRENNALLIAENGDAVPVGMIWYETKDPARAYIRDFLIYEAHRRRGYGRTILEAVERDVRRKEVPCMVLHVFELDTPAIRLYEKCGFVVERTGNGSIGMKKKL